MNKYPAWLNLLVLAILMTGLLMALPNIYGSSPAIQLSDADGKAMSGTRLAQIVQTVENAEVVPEAAYIKDGRVVLRFDSVTDQQTAEVRLRERYGREASIALTLAPQLPEWERVPNSQ